MVGLYQAYVAMCNRCGAQQVVLTAWQAAARKLLSDRGWGTSQGAYYCPDHLSEQQRQTRQQAKQQKGA